MQIQATELKQQDPSIVSQIDLSFLPFAAQNYSISPNIDDYLIFTTLICPSDLPNRNGIAFPLSELIRFTPTPSPHMVYKGWCGCPLHLEHNNLNPKDAIGIIFDTSLTKIQGVQGNIWAVTGVLGIDKTKNQEIARKFADGEINTVSMGALASSFTCSICGAINDEFHGCSHIPANSTGDVNFYPVVDSEGNIEIAFLNAHGLDPIETSVVADPAWAPALSDTILQK